MREIWVHNTVARMLDNDENNLVSGRYLTVANMQEVTWAMLPTDTASGAVASFPDGADGAPVERLTVSIEPVQEGSGDPSPDNVRPISGWTAAEVNVNGETITHEFVDELGNTLTVYGGEDELIAGKLRVTRQKAALSANWFWLRSTSYPGGFYVPVQSELGYKTNTPFICSHAKTVNTLSEYVAGTCYCDGSINFRLMPTDGSSTVQDWKNFITAQAEAGTPIEICYELASPLEYDLTREDIRTLYGDNTIFADCGDVSVTYKADIGLYIDKKLAGQNAALTSSMNNITVLDTVKAAFKKRG